MDLSVLANLGNAYNDGDAIQKKQQMAQLALALDRMKLQQGTQGMAAQGALGRALGGGMPMQQPPVPMGAGQPSMPARPQQAPMGGGMPSPQGGGGAPPMPQPGGAPPQGGMPPGGGGPGIGGGMTLQQLAQTIRQSNPNIDDATLWQAVVEAQHVLAPQAKAELQRDLAMMKLDMQRQQLEARIEQSEARLAQGEDRLSIQREALSMRRELAEMREKGADDRQQSRLQAQIDLLMAKARLREQVKGPELAYKTTVDQIKDVNSKISELLRGRSIDMLKPDEKKQYQQWVSERDKLRSDGTRIRDEASKKGVKLPGIGAAVNGGAKIDVPDVPDAQPSKSSPPKVGEIIDGYRFKGGDPAKPENYERVQ